jgi:FkbM family methyltransferase
VGAEARLDRAGHVVGRALECPETRRNRQDDERASMLAAAVLARDSSCLDVGANQGQLLSVFTALAPLGHHIAYEPVPLLRAELARRFPQVDVRGAAVSDHCGESSFFVHRQLPSRSSLRPVGYSDRELEQICVPVESLDERLPRDFAPRLLKLDVEGAEHLVLRGGLAMLRRHRPLVLFEHQKQTASHFRSGPDELFGLLVHQAEMRIFDMSGRGPYSRSEFQAVYESGTRHNFFAAPSG